ncbi:MAG: hypothetical protein ABR543_10170 [Gemmatimonadaceae bacterium]
MSDHETRRKPSKPTEEIILLEDLEPPTTVRGGGGGGSGKVTFGVDVTKKDEKPST